MVDGVPAEGRPFGFFLFSGGGNDLVGDQFCIWLKILRAGMTAQEAIDTPRFDAVLEIVEADYRDLVRFETRIRQVVSTYTKTNKNIFVVPTQATLATAE